MAATPWIAAPPAPARRLAVAIVASACVHALLTHVPAEPGGRRGVAGGVATPLSVRIVTAEPEVPVAQLPRIERPPIAAPAPRPERKRAETAPAPAAQSTGTGAGGIDLPDATYYGVRQLDVFPALASGFELHYPARASAADVKGRVALLVLIDSEGNVNDVSIVEAQPAGYFEEDALRTFRGARFTPAMKGGRPVKSRIVIEVNYGG